MESQPYNATSTVADGTIALASACSDKKRPSNRHHVDVSSDVSSPNTPHPKQIAIKHSSQPPFEAKPPPPAAANIEMISILSDDLILAIALCLLDAKDLTCLEKTNHRWRRVLRSDEELWINLCAHRWKKCPRYKALALDEAEWSRNHPRWGVDGAPPDLQADTPPDSPSWKWKNRYQWVESDKQRTDFHSRAELESLGWCWVNPSMTNRVERCQFRDGTLTGVVANPNPYTLAPIDQEKYQRIWNFSCLGDVGGLLPGRQELRIAWGYGNEELIVARVESSGEWVVTAGGWRWMFASCDNEGKLEYANSVFQRRDEARQEARQRQADAFARHATEAKRAREAALLEH